MTDLTKFVALVRVAQPLKTQTLVYLQGSFLQLGNRLKYL